MKPPQVPFALLRAPHRPLFHFIQLEGDYSYTPAYGSGPTMSIPEGHFNIFYFSKIEGTLQYKAASRKTLEVLFTEDFLTRVPKRDFSETFRVLSNGIKRKQSFLLWEQSRPIPPELKQKIREIIGCRYCSHIKKNLPGS